jgi:hypothetical protein
MMNPNLRSDGITRRDAIKVGLAGAASLALGDPGATARRQPSCRAARRPRRPARSVIQIWMWGGPSHVDTFDPKPDAGRDYTGPLDKPIPTNVDGIQVGQLLPNLAKQADKFSIIRSMTHGVNAHETASYLMQTGRMPGRISFAQRRGGGLAVQGLRRRLRRPDRALCGADPDAGPIQ